MHFSRPTLISGSTDDDYVLEGDAKPEDWNPEEDSEDQEDESILNFPWEKNVRLPSTILPQHYELYLFPELAEGMFSGKVDIEVESQESRDYFLAHVKYLEIIDAKLSRNGNNVDLIEAMEYEPNEFYVLRTRDIVPAGKYVMHFGKFLIERKQKICLLRRISNWAYYDFSCLSSK